MERRSRTVKTILDVVYRDNIDGNFLPGLLPTNKDIIEVMMRLLRPKSAGASQRSRQDAAKITTNMLMDHWVFCNIYTLTANNVKKKVLDLYEAFVSIHQTRKDRLSSKAYIEKATKLNVNAPQLFDIITEDPERRKKQENLYGVKVGQEDIDFYNDQKTNRIMYCDSYVDRKWLKHHNRMVKSAENMEKMKIQQSQTFMVASEEELGELGDENTDEGGVDETYNPDDDDDDVAASSSSQKRKRRLFESELLPADYDDLPFKYRHLRESERKLKPTVYETIDKLKSVYHLTQLQAEAAIIVVGNKLFNRQWKFHKECDTLDLDTLPDDRNARTASKAIEVMTIAEIAKEVMNADSNVGITYSDDGSKKQGAGKFIVQGITINGKHRALPTLNIEAETRQNLAQLKQTTFKILEAASGIPASTLFSRVDFILTDQTSHNLEVEDLVCEAFEIEKQPFHLFCNVHPSLMFNRCIVKAWKSIEEKIGRDKIYSGFLVEVTNNRDTVTEQALDCITRLINHDFDHKPWNYSAAFDESIAPKNNVSVSLKDERFNRLTLTCAVTLYHLEDIISFLDKFQHVTNQLACISRSFLELEFLPIMFAVGAFIGLHLIEPFLSLTTSSNTDYKKLIPAFKQLYKDLTDTKPEKFLQTDEPAFLFVSKERFIHSRFKPEILEVMNSSALKYRESTIKMLQVLFPELANAFANQKGKIFGFGDPNPYADDRYRVDLLAPAKLTGTPINNLNEERSVGFINYELGIRGATKLEAASSSQVKNKSADLVDRRESGDYNEFRKKTAVVKDLILKWNKKQDVLRKENLEVKLIANIAVERRRNKDLISLKDVGGPFTTPTELEIYLNSIDTDDVKNKRLYLEVRYSRDSSLSIPKSSDIFKLKKNHRNLSTNVYAENLKIYLSNITCKNTASMDDFVSALENLY